MSFENYKRKKKEVVEILNNIKVKLEKEDIIKLVDQKIKNIEDDRFIISIFGHFSNGKSTFLNALMGFGEEVLIEDDLPSTAAITRLRAPQSSEMLNKAEVIFNNGNIEIIDIKELGKYSATNDDYNVEFKIKEVILYLDSEYLKNGVEIVDTPGFNSTHEVHTEIAKNHVAKSDASIYMFSYEKPGSEEEFKFLNYINKYMNRIFFVVNKIDLCDRTENTIENTVENLREKLISKDVNIEGKEIYPISSKLAKEAILEESQSKKEHSRFEFFKDGLGNYLTSEENLKDRLLEPISAVQTRLNMERELLNEKMSACSKDSEELTKEIELKKKIIIECEEEIKDKKRNINKEVRDVMNNVKTNFQENSGQVIKEVKEELNEINTEFDIALADFSNMAIGVYDKIVRNWEVTRGNLEDEFATIIEENIDDDKKVDKIKNEIMDIIHKSLDIERIDVSDPKFDFKELDKIDKEIQKSKNEYDRTRNKLSECNNDRMKIESLMEQKESIEKDISRLYDEKRTNLDSIGNAQVESGFKSNRVERKRKGIFGGLGNILFGAKVTMEQEHFTDYSAVNFAKEQRKAVENEYSEKVDLQKRLYERKINEMIVMGDVEGRLLDEEFENKEARKKYLQKLNSSDEIKNKMSAKLIKVSRDNYYKEIKNVCDEYVHKASIFLDGQRNLLINIIKEVINDEIKELDNKKESLYSITTLKNKSPEQLQEEFKILTLRLVNVIDAIDQVKKYKEKI